MGKEQKTVTIREIVGEITDMSLQGEALRTGVSLQDLDPLEVLQGNFGILPTVMLMANADLLGVEPPREEGDEVDIIDPAILDEPVLTQRQFEDFLISLSTSGSFLRLSAA